MDRKVKLFSYPTTELINIKGMEPLRIFSYFQIFKTPFIPENGQIKLLITKTDYLFLFSTSKLYAKHVRKKTTFAKLKKKISQSDTRLKM